MTPWIHTWPHTRPVHTHSIHAYSLAESNIFNYRGVQAIGQLNNLVMLS